MAHLRRERSSTFATVFGKRLPVVYRSFAGHSSVVRRMTGEHWAKKKAANVK
jgi:hypothetical protein